MNTSESILLGTGILNLLTTVGCVIGVYARIEHRLTHVETLLGTRKCLSGSWTASLCAGTAALMLVVFVFSCAPLIQTGGSQSVVSRQADVPPMITPIPIAEELKSPLPRQAAPVGFMRSSEPQKPAIVLAGRQATIAQAGNNSTLDTSPKNTATETVPPSRWRYLLYGVAGVAALALVAFFIFTNAKVGLLFPKVLP